MFRDLFHAYSRFSIDFRSLLQEVFYFAVLESYIALALYVHRW